MAAKSCGVLGKIYEIEFGCPYPDCECEGQMVMKSA
jgi:hypothetical protein